nr:hypothetical protein Iba_scaffold14627CG0010 [Ipomoea batatas]
MSSQYAKEIIQLHTKRAIRGGEDATLNKEAWLQFAARKNTFLQIEELDNIEQGLILQQDMV